LSQQTFARRVASIRHEADAGVDTAPKRGEFTRRRPLQFGGRRHCQGGRRWIRPVRRGLLRRPDTARRYTTMAGQAAWSADLRVAPQELSEPAGPAARLPRPAAKHGLRRTVRLVTADRADERI